MLEAASGLERERSVARTSLALICLSLERTGRFVEVGDGIGRGLWFFNSYRIMLPIACFFNENFE
jgi:hypothetical protein